MDMETKSLLKEMEEKSVYAEMFLERKMTGTGRQTYIHGSLYGELGPDTSGHCSGIVRARVCEQRTG